MKRQQNSIKKNRLIWQFLSVSVIAVTAIAVCVSVSISRNERSNKNKIKHLPKEFQINLNDTRRFFLACWKLRNVVTNATMRTNIDMLSCSSLLKFIYLQPIWTKKNNIRGRGSDTNTENMNSFSFVTTLPLIFLFFRIIKRFNFLRR